MPGMSVPKAPSTRPQLPSVRLESTSRSIVVVSPTKRPPSSPPAVTVDDGVAARTSMNSPPASPSLPAAPMEEVLVLQSRDPNTLVTTAAGSVRQCEHAEGAPAATAVMDMHASPGRRRDMSTSTASAWPPCATSPLVLASTAVDRHDVATSPVRSPPRRSPEMCSTTVVVDACLDDIAEGGDWPSPQPVVPDGPQLVGWTASAADFSDDVVEVGMPVTPRVEAPPQRSVAAHRVPTPTFVVPSRSSSVESRDSRSLSTKRWEEVRTPSSHMRGPAASIRPQRTHPVGYESVPVPVAQQRHSVPSPQRAPPPNFHEEIFSVHPTCAHNDAADVLAVAGLRLGGDYGMRPWAAASSYNSEVGPNLASYSTQSAPNGTVARYTTEDFFPTKVRTSLSRSASPDGCANSTAKHIPPRPARPPVPVHSGGHRTMDVQLAPRWGDISNTTEATGTTNWGSRAVNTPMDSLDCSSAVVAATAQAYVALSRNPCWDAQRVADAVATSLCAPSCSDDGSCASVASQGHNNNLNVSKTRPPLAGPCVGSPGCDVEVEDDETGAEHSSTKFKATGGTPPRAAPTPRAVRGRADPLDDDVALDITCMPSRGTTDYQGPLLDALGQCTTGASLSATEGRLRAAGQRAPPSPAHSTSSFLTIVSDRAASARACSNDILDRVITSPTRSRSQSLSAAMENVLPPSTSPPQAARGQEAPPPAAATVTRSASYATVSEPSVANVEADGGSKDRLTEGVGEVTRRQDSLHSLVQTFSRNSEERELLLLEAQRQRVAAEAAVIEMQLKSMDRAALQRASGSPSPRPVHPYQNNSAASAFAMDANPQDRCMAQSTNVSSLSQPRASRDANRTGLAAAATPTTLQDLFGMAARSATRSKSSTSASPQRTTTADMERRLTHLEALVAATGSPETTRQSAPAAHAATATASSAIRCHSVASSSSSSSMGGSRTAGKLSSTGSSCTVSPPSDAGGPLMQCKPRALTADAIAAMCSQLRSLTRPLLSQLIRSDERTDGTVSLEACAKTVHTVLNRSTDGAACSVEEAHAFVNGMLPRVRTAHNGGSRVDVRQPATIPYAAFVSTIVEIASEGGGGAPEHGTALQAYFAN